MCDLFAMRMEHPPWGCAPPPSQGGSVAENLLKDVVGC